MGVGSLTLTAASDVMTTVDWDQHVLTTRGGTAMVTSEVADWRQDRDARAQYPPLRRHALYVAVCQTSRALTDPYFVVIECAGGFSGAAAPPEMSDVKFYVAKHSDGHGAALQVRFERAHDEVGRVGDAWAIPWRVNGVFTIGQGLDVEFGARLLVDTYGMFHLEEPWVLPESGQLTAKDGQTELPWRADLDTELIPLVPTLRISASRG